MTRESQRVKGEGLEHEPLLVLSLLTSKPYTLVKPSSDQRGITLIVASSA